jgi:pyruvate ferredoxin oxidoreductase gamma subunit
MIEIRIHGRGGQGIVTSGELLGFAAFSDGKYAQVYPSFGSERMGSAVTTFVRIDDRPIRKRTLIYNPDFVIIQDSTLLNTEPVLEGLKPSGIVLVNTKRPVEALGLKLDSRVFTIPAAELAMEVLGRPIVNTTILGAFAAASGAISLEGIRKALEHRFTKEMAEKNIKAAMKGYNFIKERKQ